jgi:hypothetical protein
MISVEKRVLTVKKNYLNMAIQLRRNFRRFYFKRFYKEKIKNYKNFLKKYKLGFYNLKRKKKKLRFKKKLLKRNLKRRVITFRSYKRLLRRLYIRGYKKRFFFQYLKLRVESIRLKKYLSKFKWRNKRTRWARKYRRGLKRVYFGFLLNKSHLSIRHFKSSFLFYKSHGLYRFLKHFVKFSRLRAILKKYGKVFKDKKKKKKNFFEINQNSS